MSSQEVIYSQEGRILGGCRAYLGLSAGGGEPEGGGKHNRCKTSLVAETCSALRSTSHNRQLGFVYTKPPLFLLWLLITVM